MATLPAMRSTRMMVERLQVGDYDLGVSYADVFVVVREGELVTLGTNATTGDDDVARRVDLWLGNA